MAVEQGDSGQSDVLEDEKKIAETEVIDKENHPEQGAGAATGEKAADAIADLDKLHDQIAVLEQKSKENLDKALRASAELENVRKRSSRDVENAHKYALERFLTDLLPVLDSLELGMNAAQSAEDVESLREGMDLTLQKFNSVMEKFGIKEIFPQGEKFNPEMHEAVSMQELEGAESGTITAVMQKGFELNGRLVRPAMVVVAK